MAENERKINTCPLIGIIWFFIGVVMEWFAIMIENANKWEEIAVTCTNGKAVGIGGWTLLIFFIITLIALVIYLICQLYNVCNVIYEHEPENRTQNNPLPPTPPKTE